MNTLLHNEEQGTPNMMFKEWRVNSIIVSAQFWPQFKTETLELPENIAFSAQVSSLLETT